MPLACVFARQCSCLFPLSMEDTGGSNDLAGAGNVSVDEGSPRGRQRFSGGPGWEKNGVASKASTTVGLQISKS